MLGAINQATETINRSYPCRASQIKEVTSIIAYARASSACVFVQGPPATGKTSIVRDLLQALELPHAYVSCNERKKTRDILDTVLHQLKGGKRTRDNGYESTVRCDSISDFLVALPKFLPSQQYSTTWIVLDNCHRLAANDIVSTLSRLPDEGHSVGLIVISSVPWATGAFLSPTHSIVPPIAVNFPAYTSAELIKILTSKMLPRTAEGNNLLAAYRHFVHSSVPAIVRATRNLLDARAILHRLWPQYSAPLREGIDLQAPALMNKIRGDMQRAIRELDVGGGGGCASASLFTAAQLYPMTKGQPTEQRHTTNTTSVLAFELPYVSKLLLLAAYVASRNKATADRIIFDPGYSHRGRHNSQAHDRQTENAAEAALRGPHSFPLERLLQIFYCLYDQHGPHEERNEGEIGIRNIAFEVQRAEISMQLTTLVSLQLLSTGGGDVLEGCSYRYNLADDLAFAIASNVKLRLGDYLRLA